MPQRVPLQSTTADGVVAVETEQEIEAFSYSDIENIELMYPDEPEVENTLAPLHNSLDSPLLPPAGSVGGPVAQPGGSQTSSPEPSGSQLDRSDRLGR